VAYVGEDVEPYVESRYPHVADRLYRREALAVAFNERFNILAPVDRRLCRTRHSRPTSCWSGRSPSRSPRVRSASSVSR
jgi:hypothetical protein